MVYFSFPLHWLMEQTFNSRDAGRQGQHHYLVVCLDLEFVGGDEAFTIAGDAADDRIKGHGQLTDGLAGDSRSRPHVKFYYIGIDAAEALQGGDLRAEGVFHHVAGRDEFLVDDGVDADVLRD